MVAALENSELALVLALGLLALAMFVAIGLGIWRVGALSRGRFLAFCLNWVFSVVLMIVVADSAEKDEIGGALLAIIFVSGLVSYWLLRPMMAHLAEQRRSEEAGE